MNDHFHFTLRVSLTFLILLMAVLRMNAQSVRVELEKDTIGVDELIKVSIKIDFEPDSVSFPNFKNFAVSFGPQKLKQIRFADGLQTSETEYIYKLRPLDVGSFKMECISAYLNESIIPCENVFLTVVPSDKKESRIKLERLVFDSSKPEGTIRISFHEEIGFIEKFENSEWVFIRQLNRKEINKIKKIE